MALKRLPFISQLFNGSVGRNCSSSCLPQGAHMPKGLETKLEFLFIITWIFRLLLKISVEGNFCECDLYFWRLCSQQSYTGMSKAEWIWLSTNKQWKDMQLVIFCICSLCSPRVTPSYLFSHMDRQSFLAHDGIQTLDMLSLGFGPNKDRFSAWRPISDSCTCTNKSCRHWWFNGRILACHVGDPGPIPGQCKDSLLLSKMRACTISKNAQTSGAEAIFVWAQP